MVLVLAGLGATTGGTATKSALAAASAGVVGAQAVVNKDLYYQKTIPALISQMQANRAEATLTIMQNLRQSDDTYPLSLAEIDLKKLEEAGSVLAAVNNISQKSTDQKNDANAQIQKLHSLAFSNTSSAKAIRAWLYPNGPNGKVDQSRFDTLQAWLNRQPEAFLKDQGYPPGAFVSGDTDTKDIEPIRQRALVELKIPQ